MERTAVAHPAVTRLCAAPGRRDNRRSAGTALSGTAVRCADRRFSESPARHSVPPHPASAVPAPLISVCGHPDGHLRFPVSAVPENAQQYAENRSPADAESRSAPSV